MNMNKKDVYRQLEDEVYIEKRVNELLYVAKNQGEASVDGMKISSSIYLKSMAVSLTDSFYEAKYSLISTLTESGLPKDLSTQLVEDKKNFFLYQYRELGTIHKKDFISMVKFRNRDERIFKARMKIETMKSQRKIYSTSRNR